MSARINGTSISLTKGDTLKITIEIKNADGTVYTPISGDAIRFAMKKNITDAVCLIIKEIPVNTMQLEFAPSDTANMDYGIYVYDMQITLVNGDVYTFVTESSFIITEEVY